VSLSGTAHVRFTVTTHERTRIAFDVTPLIGHRTGVGRSVAELVVALGGLDDGPELVPYVLGFRSGRHRAELPVGTRIVKLSTRALLRSWSHTDFPAIDHWIDGAQVVHATNFIVPPSRRPAVVTVHDCSFDLFPETVDAVVGRFGPVLRRAIARGAVVHVTTEHVAGEVEDTFGPGLREAGRIAVVPFGVPALGPPTPMPAALATLVAGGPYVLAIGTLERRKNMAALVRAFGSVATHHPDVRLIVAGRDGNARPAVDAAITALPPAVRQRVVLTGPVGDGGRRSLLEGARLLAYPSLYEGFGFPMLEAMTLGVPVLAARAGALPEVAGDAAELADPRDPDELAAALDRLLGDDGRREDLVARGHERVRSFSWDLAARGLSELYDRLAG
jgi:glycosyltransferase involved in cell wall biosynthesis